MAYLTKYREDRTTFINAVTLKNLQTMATEQKMADLFKALDDTQIMQGRDAMLQAHKHAHDYIDVFVQKLVKTAGASAGNTVANAINTFKASIQKLAADYLQKIPPARQRANDVHN